MTDIPAELRKLWAERDRTGETDAAVLMELRDDDPILNGPKIPREKPPRKDQPAPEPVEPIREVKLFPTYKIGPQPVNLATFSKDDKRKRE